MGIFSSMEISASGMKAERTRLDLISMNIANQSTVQTAGEPVYRPKRLATVPGSPNFRSFLAGFRTTDNMGVKVAGVVEENVPPRLEYEPNHPMANKDGYVAYPGINILDEMVSAISASRTYEANVTAFNESKKMINKSFEIGKG